MASLILILHAHSHSKSFIFHYRIETVLLSTYNICFGCEIRKYIFLYALITLDLYSKTIHLLKIISPYPAIIFLIHTYAWVKFQKS